MLSILPISKVQEKTPVLTMWYAWIDLDLMFDLVFFQVLLSLGPDMIRKELVIL